MQRQNVNICIVIHCNINGNSHYILLFYSQNRNKHFDGNQYQGPEQNSKLHHHKPKLTSTSKQNYNSQFQEVETIQIFNFVQLFKIQIKKKNL